MASFDREKQIFLAALELPSAAERDAYLRGACADDSALYQRLQGLIAGHDQTGGPLDVPPSGLDIEATRDRSFAESVGAQIGPYKLLQEIGQGGMGVVYLAEQFEPVRRKVALKIIKPGMDTRQVIARFEAERQALSLMDHPNIAKVLDAGATTSGRPYFVMELVKGQPITQYCDEHHLTPRQRLEMLLPVCQAIQHAHQKGIIHRDIKPSNILVAEYDHLAVPKVIDLGVAKAISQPLTEKTMFTGIGQVVGTLEYMSPEQAKVNQLDIDTRSDIYSLGVLMYELLTGTTPLDKQRLKSAAWDEMLRIIREDEPPKPSTRLSESKDSLPSVSALRQTEPAKLTKLVRGELDWIVMKALEKERARRYETANGLATDIQRYLDDEPVSACPPSAAYRFGKFARRNKRAMVTTSLVAAALFLGLVGTAWQAIRATLAERQAVASAKAEASQRKVAEAAAESEREARTSETEQRQKAEASEQQAAEEAALAKAVNEFLQQDLLGLAGAEAQLDAKLQPDPNLKLATLLDRALASVEDRFADQPRVRADVQATLGQAFFSIGRFGASAMLREQVRRYRETTLGLEHPDTLRAMGNLAESYRCQGNYAEAEPLHTQSLEISRRVLGPEHPIRLNSMNNLALLFKQQARYVDAERLLTECLQIQRRLFGPQHPATRKSMSNLALVYQDQARYDEAEPLQTQSLEISRRVLGPEHPITLISMNNLAVLFKHQARYAEAESLITKCLEIQGRVLGPEHPDTLTSMNNLAWLHVLQARYDEAESLLTHCLEIEQRVLGPEHPDTLRVINNLAGLYKDQSKYDKAERLYVLAFETLCRVVGPEHPDTLTSMSNVALVYQDQARFADAEPLGTQCLEIRRRVLGTEHPDTLTSLNNLAVLYSAQGKYAAAELLCTECLDITRRIFGLEHSDTLTITNNLAGLYQNQGRYAEAEPLFAQFLEITRHLKGPEHPRTLISMNNLAVLYWRQKKLDQSIPLFEKLLEIRKRTQSDDHPDTLFVMANLGVNLRDAGRFAEAAPLLEEAYQASRKHPSLSWVERPLADVYLKAGKSAEAEALLQECLTLREKQAPNDWSTFNTKSMLGGALLGQKRFADAEPLLVAGYEGMKQRENTIPEPAKNRLPEALDRLIELYTATNQPDEAQKRRVERAKYPLAAESATEKK